MYKNKTIRKLCAGAMLLLFALSIIPKQFLHDKITGHTHDYSKSTEPVNVKAAKNNFQCNWEEQSLVSPFTDQAGLPVPEPLITFSSYNKQTPRWCHSTTLFLSALRGPPSLS